MDETTLTAREIDAIAKVWRRWARPDARLILRRSSRLGQPVLRIECWPMGFRYVVDADGTLMTSAGREPTWRAWAEQAA